jgi:hypothetical protein
MPARATNSFFTRLEWGNWTLFLYFDGRHGLGVTAYEKGVSMGGPTVKSKGQADRPLQDKGSSEGEESLEIWQTLMPLKSSPRKQLHDLSSMCMGMHKRELCQKHVSATNKREYVNGGVFEQGRDEGAMRGVWLGRGSFVLPGRRGSVVRQV